MKQYKVLDLSTLYPGPLCSHLLVGMGFAITKIEDLKNSDALRQMWPSEQGVSVAYKKLNEKKEIVELDYKDEDSRTKILEMVKISDVLIENFRPGRLDKLGLGYEECKAVNPKIVYCSITGFGSSHPLSKKAAHDINLLGISGYFNLNNNFSVPPIQFADVTTAYDATVQILAALLKDESAKLDVSMLKSIMNSMLLISSGEEFIKRDFKPEEFILWGNHPCYGIYKTADGKYMALGAIEPSFWNDFCNALNVTELSNNQFDTSGEVKEKVQKLVTSKTQQEWIEADLDCFTPVLSYLESKSHGFI